MKNAKENLRADARLNRERILAAARRAFAVSPETSLNAIAKAAGVGPGTLYRHFPSRQALVLGVYRNEIEALVALAPELIALKGPEEAFGLWCGRLAEYGQIKHGLADALHDAITDSDYQETYWPVVGAIDQLLKAGAYAGVFRPAIDAEDILLALGFLWRIKPNPGAKSQASRLIDLMMAGLRA